VAFAEVLAYIRNQRGMYQRELAEAAGVTQACISHLELGQREPGLATLKALCDALDVSADVMLEREPISLKEKRDPVPQQ
jgi:transcriptional regulator with XRE-family HTH domain